jgi:hypothetical protein
VKFDDGTAITGAFETNDALNSLVDFTASGGGRMRARPPGL